MKLVLVVLALISCEPTRAPYRSPKPERYTRLNESPRPLRARALASIKIYRAKPPDERFGEVAEMVDIGDDESAALEKLKLSAAGVGCDGLIVGTARVEAWTRASLTGFMPFEARTSEVNMSGTCIMFLSDQRTHAGLTTLVLARGGRRPLDQELGVAWARLGNHSPPIGTKIAGKDCLS